MGQLGELRGSPVNARVPALDEVVWLPWKFAMKDRKRKKGRESLEV